MKPDWPVFAGRWREELFEQRDDVADTWQRFGCAGCNYRFTCPRPLPERFSALCYTLMRDTWGSIEWRDAHSWKHLTRAKCGGFLR